MAVFSVEIADADVNRVLTAIAANYSRPDQVANPAYATIENPNFDPAIEENEDTNPRFVSNGEPATLWACSPTKGILLFVLPISHLLI